MTKDEAFKLAMQACKETWNEKTCKQIKEALEQTTWIPVSERLPEKYTYTLWCASSGYVRSDYFNGEFWEDAKKYCYEVVAWMPLPEPYKGE